MANSQVIPFNATPSASRQRTGGPAPADSSRNRMSAFLVAVADVLREARELEVRMLSQGGYRRFGES